MSLTMGRLHRHLYQRQSLYHLYYNSMKFRLIYLIAFLIISLFAIKYWDFSEKYSEIRFEKITPTIGLDQLINVDKRPIYYLNSLYYKNEFIGFNAIVKNHYVTVTKIGENIKKINILPISKKPINHGVIGLPPSDINDVIARYIDFSLIYPNGDNLSCHTDGVIVKTFDSHFKEIVFNASNIDFLFDTAQNRKYFGYVGIRQISSVSFVCFDEDLFLINVHPLKGNSFRSLHEIFAIN